MTVKQKVRGQMFWRKIEKKETKYRQGVIKKKNTNNQHQKTISYLSAGSPKMAEMKVSQSWVHQRAWNLLLIWIPLWHRNVRRTAEELQPQNALLNWSSEANQSHCDHELQNESESWVWVFLSSFCPLVVFNTWFTAWFVRDEGDEEFSELSHESSSENQTFNFSSWLFKHPDCVWWLSTSGASESRCNSLYTGWDICVLLQFKQLFLGCIPHRVSSITPFPLCIRSAPHLLRVRIESSPRLHTVLYVSVFGITDISLSGSYVIQIGSAQRSRCRSLTFFQQNVCK